MAPTCCSSPPSAIVAGDSLSWSRAFDDYKASDGWALAYTLVGPTAVYTVNAASNGDDFAVSIAPDTSKTWAPGAYKLVETLSTAGERVTVGITPFTISPDLAATADGGADTRSHARKVLDAIEAWLESKAPVAGTFQIGERQIQYYPIADLLVLRDRYRREVALENACGNRRGRPVYVSL